MNERTNERMNETKRTNERMNEKKFDVQKLVIDKPRVGWVLYFFVDVI